MGAGSYEIAAFFNVFLMVVRVAERELGVGAIGRTSKGTAVGCIFLSGGSVYQMFTLIPGQAAPVAGIVFGVITLRVLDVAFGTKYPASHLNSRGATVDLDTANDRVFTLCGHCQRVTQSSLRCHEVHAF